MNALRLYRVDFDSAENQASAALMKVEIDVFKTDVGGMSAHAKASTFLAAMAPVKVYLGWDGQVYPKFVAEEADVR